MIEHQTRSSAKFGQSQRAEEGLALGPFYFSINCEPAPSVRPSKIVAGLCLLGDLNQEWQDLWCSPDPETGLMQIAAKEIADKLEMPGPTAENAPNRSSQRKKSYGHIHQPP